MGQPDATKNPKQPPPGRPRQRQSDERNQAPGVRWMAAQPIRTLLHNQVILGHPDSQREKPSQDRNRPLTNQNTGQHQKDPGIEDPIRQHPNTSIPETERKDDRDEDSEDDQRPRAAISPQPRCSVPSKPRNQHCPEQFTGNPDEVGSVEQNKPKTRGEYRQDYHVEYFTFYTSLWTIVKEYDSPARPTLGQLSAQRGPVETVVNHVKFSLPVQLLSSSGWLISYYRCSRLALTTAKIALRTASALFLLGLSLLLLPQTHQLIPSVEGSTKTLHLAGYYPGGWNSSNPTITVQQGDSVTIDLSSGDGAPHQFLLDLDSDSISDQSNCPPNSSPTDDPCSTAFSGSGTTSVTFTANSAGSFKYYCTIHYPSMVGTFVVQAPGFSMLSNPSSLTIVQGSSSTSTITLSSERGFSATINLTSSVSPAGPMPTMSPTMVTISPGTPATSTLTVSTTVSTASGSYTVTVNGASGSTTNMTTVAVTVTGPDFSISSSPSSLGVIQGSSSNSSTITLTSLNGFSGTITLTSSVSQAGLNISFNPASVTISSGGSGTSTMTVSTSTTPPGFYTATINGMSGSTTNMTTVNISVTIPDFNIKTSLPSLSITQGSTATTTITLTSLSGFKGTLTLTGSVSQPGPTVTFSPASVTLASGGTVTSNMTVSTAGGTYPTATGSYPVTVTVTNGTLTHSTTVEVTVGAIPSGTGSLPLAVLIGVAAGIIAVAGTAIYLVRRRAGRNPQP